MLALAEETSPTQATAGLNEPPGLRSLLRKLLAE
jgi:hypothetical protein